MDLQVWIQADVHDADGNLIYRGPKTRSHSLVQSFMKMLFSQFSNVATVRCKDTSNTERTFSAATYFYTTAGAGTTTRGIMIGTGTNAVTIEDYALQTQVTVNWTYGAVTFSLDNPAGNEWHINVIRTFTNSTGGSVDIKEIGLVGYTGATNHLIDRTLHTITVANTAATTITYTIALVI